MFSVTSVFVAPTSLKIKIGRFRRAKMQARTFIGRDEDIRVDDTTLEADRRLSLGQVVAPSVGTGTGTDIEAGAPARRPAPIERRAASPFGGRALGIRCFFSLVASRRYSADKFARFDSRRGPS